MSTLLEKAHEIAKIAHSGQVDKAGVDYIKHPETVARFVKTEQEKIVAYLHDVIEDSQVTLSDLTEQGFPSNIVKAVSILTKKKDVPYQTYLELVKKDHLARAVKLADLKHNSDLSRLKTVTSKDLKRNQKYLEAIKFLST